MAPESIYDVVCHHRWQIERRSQVAEKATRQAFSSLSPVQPDSLSPPTGAGPVSSAMRCRPMKRRDIAPNIAHGAFIVTDGLRNGENMEVARGAMESK